VQMISVVIPTYNRVKMLERAISSIYKQTLAPAEIIVIDDGSQDSTQEMISREVSASKLCKTAQARCEHRSKRRCKNCPR